MRILLVDDHPSFRQSLALVLRYELEPEAIVQAGSVEEARRVLGEAGAIDVAILDRHLPDGSGTELVQAIHAASPGAGVLLLTAAADRLEVARAVERGADGVLFKTATVEEIVGAIRRLYAGERLFAPGEIIELLRLGGQQREEERAAEHALTRLTPREREVLQALAEGLSDQDLAERLHVSVRTARTHMANILAKLGLESRLQALVFALRHGVARIA